MTQLSFVRRSQSEFNFLEPREEAAAATARHRLQDRVRVASEHEDGSVRGEAIVRESWLGRFVKRAVSIQRTCRCGLPGRLSIGGGEPRRPETLGDSKHNH